MSMTIADTHMNASHMDASHQPGAARFAFTVLTTALVTLILVPSLALIISYLAGGAATSTILFVYLFAFLTNAPFFAAVIALTIGTAAWPVVSHLRHHAHA